MADKHLVDGILWSVTNGVLMVERAPVGDGTIPVKLITEQVVDVEDDNGEEREIVRDRIIGRVLPWGEYRNDVLEVRICEGITTIPSQLFSGMSSLVRVILPASLRTIEPEAFAGSPVESVLVTHGLEKLGHKAFIGCANLKKIELPASLAQLGSWAFCGCRSLESVVIKGSVPSIGERTFWDCSSLKSCVLPSSVRTIDKNAFMDCGALESIVLPDELTEIGEFAFSGCKRLRSVSIPEGVTTIGKQAFFRCSSLRRVSIPNSATTVGHAAFSACDNLEEVVLPRGFGNVVDVFGFGFPRDKIVYRRRKLFSGLFGKK